MGSPDIRHVVPLDDVQPHLHGYPSPCPCAPIVVEIAAGDIEGSPFIAALMLVHSPFDGREWDSPVEYL